MDCVESGVLHFSLQRLRLRANGYTCSSSMHKASETAEVYLIIAQEACTKVPGITSAGTVCNRNVTHGVMRYKHMLQAVIMQLLWHFLHGSHGCADRGASMQIVFRATSLRSHAIHLSDIDWNEGRKGD